MTFQNKKELYDILGLTFTATAPEIRAAWRTLVMRYHPDTGVEPDVYKLADVHAAYSVLRDPERRARYDATGEYETDGVSQIETNGPAIAVIVEIFQGIINERIMPPNVVVAVERQICKKLTHLRQERGDIDNRIEFFSDLRDRIKRRHDDEKENIFRKSIDETLRKLDANAGLNDQLVENGEAALKLLVDYYDTLSEESWLEDDPESTSLLGKRYGPYGTFFSD